jgi:uncharacterized protein YqeY
MSKLQSRIKEDLKNAMREKNAFVRDTLRSLSGAIKQVEVDERRELDDGDIETILQKQIKMRKDAIEQYSAGGRPELADQEQKEITLLEGYLPKQLSDAELDGLLKEIIDATEPKAMGPVMAEAKKRIGTRAEGRRISQRVKALLG